MFDLILDTETTNMLGISTEQPEPEHSLVYDLGGVVRDTKSGEIVDSFSFVLTETFFNERLMNSAYYADKRTIYLDGMGTDWEYVSTIYAWEYVNNIIKKYNIRTVWAYNARFDVLTLNNTVRHYSNGWRKYFFPYGIKVKDVWARCSNITGTKKYVLWCIEHGYISEKNIPRTGAEYVYRYIIGDTNFIESHTAKDDAMIESAILTYAQHTKKGKSRKGWGNGHVPARRIYNELRKK